jgi:hypothetical protein
MELRGILYVIGALSSAGLAWRLLSLKSDLGRLFGLVMLGWVINCLTLGTLAVHAIYTGEILPSWRGLVMNINAAFLAGCPLLLLLLFGRSRNGGK